MLLLVAALVFVAVVFRTLMPPREPSAERPDLLRRSASLGYLAGAIINLVQMSPIARHGLTTAPPRRQTALVFTQQYGFTFMFIAGVGTRALPTLSGHPRRNGAASLAAAMLRRRHRHVRGRDALVAYGRVDDGGAHRRRRPLPTAAAFALIVCASGALGRARIASPPRRRRRSGSCARRIAWMLVAARAVGVVRRPRVRDGALPTRSRSMPSATP